jgi:hypothetical protein
LRDVYKVTMSNLPAPQSPERNQTAAAELKEMQVAKNKTDFRPAIHSGVMNSPDAPTVH